MKSLLAALAGAWFAFHALTFAVPDVSAITEGVAAVSSAVESGVRVICAGLALVSLAQVNWAPLADALDRLPIASRSTPPSEEW